MKLGEMQRYHYQCEYSIPEGDYGSSIDPDGDGEWVKFTDAQAKSLTDERRIASLLAILQRLEDWGVREDKMFTETREKTLFKLISDAQTLLHEYRTQYPRVGEEQ